MKISMKWLGDLVELPASVDEVAKRLTMSGLEVEAIERQADALNGVVVAQILSSQQHPNADKLSVTKVSVGGAEPLQIVCGAKNYKVGDKVPLATVGTLLPNAKEPIKASPLRGVDSFGMLCSSRELGMNDEHAGLLILDPAAKVGTPIAQQLGLDDVILTLNVTPNRPDALSHLGVARDLSALLGKPLKAPALTLTESATEASSKISIRVDDPVGCVRYAARVIEGVTVKPSPQWLQDRLRACGVRPISNIVDVTNYVLFELGQPMHAFDLDQLASAQIIVRRAKAGERLTTLDGKDRELSTEDLLVADAERGQVLAGVMGGASSEVTAKTTRVLLESANWQPATIRRSSKRHGLHSESSHRYERGTDVSIIAHVLDRAAALLAELGGGTVLKGRVDVCPNPVAAKRVTLVTKHVENLLGAAVPAAECHHILEALGFTKISGNDEQALFEVPLVRVDVSIEEDLIEEIARIRGFESIPAALPPGLTRLEPEPAQFVVERKVRAALAGQGVDEVVNYSFVSPAELEAFGENKNTIAITNPLSVEHSVMRTTMFVGLVQNVIRATRHQAQGVRLYELGRSYATNAEGGKHRAPPANETAQVAGAIWGLRDGARSWTAKESVNDFYDAKAAVQAVLSALHIDAVTYEALENAWYHPRASAVVKHGDLVLGSLGELHPRAMKKLDAPAGLFLFQLNLDALVQAATLVPQASALTRFPSVFRDLAVVVPTEMASEAVRNVILEVGKPLVDRADIFDVYAGPQVGEGRKNLAYALRYQAADRTLTDTEVAEAHKKIVDEVTSRLGGSLRS